MATQVDDWEHDHSFGQEREYHGERRTLVVTLLTASTMVVELVAGVAFGSMALLADGVHMASHTVAIGIALAAYVYARRHAHDERFSFGTGKVNALAGFTGAILLAGFAALMAWKSCARFLAPVPIVFDHAIVVAIFGLLVNGASALLLGAHHTPHHDHGHDHDHDTHGHRHHRDDHNLRSAYLHVLADALTSLTAIVALLGGKLYGWIWLDPAMGLVGSVLVTRWAIGLLRDTSKVLLDHQAPAAQRQRIRSALEDGSGDRVVDLHLWAIAPGVHAAAISVLTDRPRTPRYYRQRLPRSVRIAHSTVEVHHRPPGAGSPTDGT